MRLLKVALLVLMFAFPVMADNRPGVPIVEPPNDDYWSCVECSRMYEVVECGGEPTGPGWMLCKGGTIRLCDGWAGCIEEPTCGQRCAIA